MSKTKPSAHSLAPSLAITHLRRMREVPHPIRRKRTPQHRPRLIQLEPRLLPQYIPRDLVHEMPELREWELPPSVVVRHPPQDWSTRGKDFANGLSSDREAAGVGGGGGDESVGVDERCSLDVGMGFVEGGSLVAVLLLPFLRRGVSGAGAEGENESLPLRPTQTLRLRPGQERHLPGGSDSRGEEERGG